MATRWGIVSAGFISGDFVAALQVLPKENHRVVAIAARSKDKAETFAKEFGIDKSYGTYEELAADPEVEVVYIGCIHPFHLKLASLMIEAGKHVLCEKPLCMNVRETKELIELAKNKQVFLMEAIWSRFFPTYYEMQNRISSGEIGTVLNAMVYFGNRFTAANRVNQMERGGGVTLDLSIYGVQFALLAFGGEKPVKIVAAGHLNEDGVDESTSVTLMFSGNRTATLITSSKCVLPNTACIFGTQGSMKIDSPFWCPEGLTSPSGRFVEPVPRSEHTFTYANSQGLSYEAEEVRKCLQNGLLEHPRITHAETILIAEILETILKQIGVSYSQDK